MNTAVPDEVADEVPGARREVEAVVRRHAISAERVLESLGPIPVELDAGADNKHVVLVGRPVGAGDRVAVGVECAGGVLDPRRALRHHRRLGTLGRRRLRLPAADQGPQRLVVVLVRRLDDRDVGVALAQHAGRDRDSGGSAADDQDLVLGRDGHEFVLLDSVRRLVGFVPGAIAAQDVADVGEALSAATGSRRPRTGSRRRSTRRSAWWRPVRPAGSAIGRPGWRSRPGWCLPRPRPGCARRRSAGPPALQRAGRTPSRSAGRRPGRRRDGRASPERLGRGSRSPGRNRFGRAGSCPPTPGPAR